MDLHAWPADANLLDEEAHELLALFEVEGVDALLNTPSEGFNFA